MPKYTNIINLQIEITTHCNAFCPGCARNIDGGELVPELKLEKMEIDLWKKITQDQFIQKEVSWITLNGMFGDPLAHPDIFDFLDMLPRHIKLEINTNGSFRNIEFWKKFAKLLNQFDKHFVVWGIDGLEDTHTIYRRGTNWQKIIDNMSAFNKAGGLSEWRMTLFEHNVHQLDQCKRLSEDLGCEFFWVRESYDDEIYAKPYKKFPATILKSPTDAAEIEKKYNYIVETNELKNTSVCPWHNTKMLQMSVDGRVWPCCYTAEEPFKKSQNDLIWTAPNIKNSLKDFSLGEILNSGFFSKKLDSIWQNNKSKICTSCIAGGIKGNTSVE